MNDITPKEASEILSHYTNLGYGIVIEGEDTTKIKQALSLAIKAFKFIDENFPKTFIDYLNGEQI